MNNNGFLLDINKIEEEYNKYLIEFEKGKFVNVQDMLWRYEYLTKQLEELVKLLQTAYDEKKELKAIINEAREELKSWKPKSKVIKLEIDYLLQILEVGEDKE